VIVNGVDHTPTPAPPLTAMMYQWSATVKGSKRTVYGDNALTDDLTGDIKYRVHGQMKALAKGQVQAAIQTLIVARGGTAPAAIAGSIEQLKQQLGEERQKLRELQRAQEQVEAEERLVNDAFQGSPHAPGPAAPGMGPPAAPPTRMQAARAEVEILRTRRRQGELWAADWLLSEDGEYLRQPSMVKILDGVPYQCRPYVVSRYCHVI
jgi:hypothetical protein